MRRRCRYIWKSSALMTMVVGVAAAFGVACKNGGPFRTTETHDDRSGEDELLPPPELRPGVGAETRVVSGCPDGDWREVLPDKDASIDDLIEKFQSGQGATFALKALARRYPFGAEIMERAKDDELCQEYLPDFGKGVWEDLNWLATTVHECGHMLDLRGIARPKNHSAYAIEGDVQFICPGASHISTDPNRVVTRDVIFGDSYSTKLPACAEDEPASADCEAFTPVYLEGEGGAQGFNLLLEEITQYVNTLAVAYAFQAEHPSDKQTGDRDGLLATLWFLQRYLKLVRTEHPDDYEFIVGNPCWQDVILTLWGRAWLYLGKTDGDKKLEITAGSLKPLVEDQELLDEIQAVRVRKGCVAAPEEP